MSGGGGYGDDDNDNDNSSNDDYGSGPHERDAAATPTAAFSWKPPSEASGDEARERLIACPDIFCDPLLPPAGDEETKPATTDNDNDNRH